MNGNLGKMWVGAAASNIKALLQRFPGGMGKITKTYQDC